MRLGKIALNRAPKMVWDAKEGTKSIKCFVSTMPLEGSDGAVSTRIYGYVDGRNKVKKGDIISDSKTEYKVFETHLADAGSDDDGLLTLEFEELDAID